MFSITYRRVPQNRLGSTFGTLVIVRYREPAVSRLDRRLEGYLGVKTHLNPGILRRGKSSCVSVMTL